MLNYDLILVALVTVYIVDVSGFTTSWRTLVARWIGTTEQRLRPLPPFDCGRCATFWACLIYAAIAGTLTLPNIVLTCALSLLSFTIGQIFILISEGLLTIIARLINGLQR